MFDMHFDLLTLAYMAKKQGREEELKEILRSYNSKQVSGVCANLYFMSRKEMTDELKYPEKINVLQMFKEAKDFLAQYKTNTNARMLYSIEGCDYILGHDTLDALYEEGLDAIIPVWNNENRYGSGNRNPERGLTREGRLFIEHAIDLGLGIDLSHANEPTFEGIIEEIAKATFEGKKPVCYASHSNIRALQDHPRNLNDKQLAMLKAVGGKLGLVAYPPFLTDEREEEKVKQSYMEHIIYAVNKMGIDSVMVSSDNMDWIKNFDSTNESAKALYSYDQMSGEIIEELTNIFGESGACQIAGGNAKKIYSKLKSQRFCKKY